MRAGMCLLTVVAFTLPAAAEAAESVELSFYFHYKNAADAGGDEYIERKANGAIPVELGKTYEVTNVSYANGEGASDASDDKNLMISMTPTLVGDNLYKVDFATFVKVGERPLTRSGSILLKMREDSSVRIDDVHEQLTVGVKVRPLTRD